MGVNRFKACPQALKSAVSKLTARQAAVSEERRGWASVSGKMVTRIAQHLLKTNRHLKEFEVELDDEQTCRGVEIELTERGCRVKRVPFKWRLQIICPDEPAKRAA